MDEEMLLEADAALDLYHEAIRKKNNSGKGGG